TSSSSYMSFFTVSSPSALYTLSLHDALPIYYIPRLFHLTTSSAADNIRTKGWNFYGSLRTIFAVYKQQSGSHYQRTILPNLPYQDRKSTRLNSSHVSKSYAVFCLKKKITT